MSIVRIPISADSPAFKFQVDLEGTTYTLAFSFNSRMERWTMDILDQAGNAIRTGIKVISTWAVNRQYAIDAVPPGAMCFVDLADEDKPASFDDLGSRVVLMYEESDG